MDGAEAAHREADDMRAVDAERAQQVVRVGDGTVSRRRSASNS